MCHIRLIRREHGLLCHIEHGLLWSGTRHAAAFLRRCLLGHRLGFTYEFYSMLALPLVGLAFLLLLATLVWGCSSPAPRERVRLAWRFYGRSQICVVGTWCA